MTPEQAERQRRSFAYGNVKIENDSIPWERFTGRRRGWKRGERAICFLSGRAGLRCLNLFSRLYGTTEVVPFHEFSCVPKRESRSNFLTSVLYFAHPLQLILLIIA
jgi:hypothetical protein